MTAPLPPGLACERLDWLPAEASQRRYGRLFGPRAVQRPTAVVMTFAKGTAAEEVSRVLRATELLAQAGLPVPEIFDAVPEQRWILQEDLGDITLAGARSAGISVAPLYSEAVGLLERMAPLSMDTSPKPPLNERRLQTELHQFAVLALQLPDGGGAGLKIELANLVDYCSALPTVLCHRDYHSRNLMVCDGRLRMIDHQDALMGPGPYDRVSLAYDPYVELAEPIRQRIAGSADGTAEVGIQRLAKAIGTFADKGEHWRQWITPAARTARKLITQSDLSLPLLDLAFAAVGAAATKQASSP
ncbi:MAG: aminoglycoside/choline kinase family phosphotransferase [Pseudohongiellaceae bacterium]|jgi:aminoglycoside/choline kinase family phosphotransferase